MKRLAILLAFFLFIAGACILVAPIIIYAPLLFIPYLVVMVVVGRWFFGFLERLYDSLP